MEASLSKWFRVRPRYCETTCIRVHDCTLVDFVLLSYCSCCGFSVRLFDSVIEPTTSKLMSRKTQLLCIGLLSL